VSPGVLSALGDATTRMRSETARSFCKQVADTDEADVLAVLREMETQTRSELKADGLADADITSCFEVDVRYAGQAFEVPLSIDPETLHRDGIQGIIKRFDEEHRRLFTFNMDSPHEIVNLRVVALGQALDLPAAELPKGDGNPAAAKLRDHELWMDGRIPGPAIVIEMDSTTLIESDCAATVDAVGNILIRPA
jgi:N-methylhydantoinase A